MKRTLIAIISAILATASVCSLAGCGSDSSSKAQSSAAETTAAASSAASENAGGSLSVDDTSFVSNGVKVELDGDADAAVAALGQANDVSSQMSCHGEGEDKTYTYTGFVLNTYPLNGKDRVLEVIVSSADFPTSKGVKVGDSLSVVTAAYGENYSKIGQAYYVYQTADGKKQIRFSVENDAVTEIDYYFNV